MNTILLIVGGFFAFIIAIVYLAISVPFLIEDSRRKRSHYVVMVEDYSSGTLVKTIDYANKIKLKNSDTYLIALTKAKKYVPLPTEAMIEKEEEFQLQENLPEGEWKKEKRGLMVARDEESVSEPLMGLYKKRILLPLITADGHNFFYKRKIDKSEIKGLTKQVISESRKLNIENILRYLSFRRTKTSNWDKYATPAAVIIVIVFSGLMWLEMLNTQKEIASIASSRQPVYIQIDRGSIHDYLNGLNLSYNGQKIDPVANIEPGG